jgi:hypothetical protein
VHFKRPCRVICWSVLHKFVLMIPTCGASKNISYSILKKTPQLDASVGIDSVDQWRSTHRLDICVSVVTVTLVLSLDTFTRSPRTPAHTPLYLLSQALLPEKSIFHIKTEQVIGSRSANREPRLSNQLTLGQCPLWNSKSTDVINCCSPLHDICISASSFAVQLKSDATRQSDQSWVSVPYSHV